MEGYQNYHGKRESSIKSGCGFYVKEGIKFKPRKDLDIACHDTDNEFQSTWIEILNDNNPNIIIGVYYRHPRKNSDNTFLENLKITLHSLINNNKICLVAGDFNYDILKYEHNPIINEFINLMYSNFFQSCILELTRVVLNSRPSLIENIYINTYDKTIHGGNFLEKVTDHMPNFCIIEDTFKVKKNRKIRIRDMQQFEKDKFLKDLEELKNPDLLQYKDCNIMYSKFNEKYLQINDKNIPVKKRNKT